MSGLVTENLARGFSSPILPEHQSIYLKTGGGSLIGGHGSDTQTALDLHRVNPYFLVLLDMEQIALSTNSLQTKEIAIENQI